MLTFFSVNPNYRPARQPQQYPETAGAPELVIKSRRRDATRERPSEGRGTRCPCWSYAVKQPRSTFISPSKPGVQKQYLSLSLKAAILGTALSETPLPPTPGRSASLYKIREKTKKTRDERPDVVGKVAKLITGGSEDVVPLSPGPPFPADTRVPRLKKTASPEFIKTSFAGRSLQKRDPLFDLKLPSLTPAH